MSVDGQRMSKSLGNVVDPSEAASRHRRRSAAAVPGQGSDVRRRRRFLVGAAAGALQRRSRQQPRQPGEPDRGDGREVPRRNGEGRRRAGAAWRPSQAQAVADYRQHMDAFALEKGAADAFRIVDAANEYIAETRAVGARARRAAGATV